MVNTQKQLEEAYLKNVYQKLIDKRNELRESCLLYTSDAADE